MADLKIFWHRWEDPLKPALGHHVEHEDGDTMQHNLGQVLIGPLGIMSSDPSVLVSHNMNFWEANANFNLTRSVLQQIEQVEGVETIRLLTRYRMIVSFGKAFDDGAVQKSIDKALGLN